MEIQDTLSSSSIVSGKRKTSIDGVLTSDMGLMLLREVASKIGIVFVANPSYVDHTMMDLISQRVNSV